MNIQSECAPVDANADIIAAMAKNRGSRGPYGGKSQPPTRLAALLLAKGMTEAQVRKMTGLSTGRLNAAKQGKKMTPETLLALTRGLQEPLTEITDDRRLILQVASMQADERDLEILAQTAAAIVERTVRPKK